MLFSKTCNNVIRLSGIDFVDWGHVRSMSSSSYILLLRSQTFPVSVHQYVSTGGTTNW